MYISKVDTKLFEETIRLLNESFPTDDENSVEWWAEIFVNNHVKAKGLRFGIQVEFEYSSKRIYYTGDSEKFLAELKSAIDNYKED